MHSGKHRRLVGKVNEYLEETINAVRTIQAFGHAKYDEKFLAMSRSVGSIRGGKNKSARQF